jgi:hypothetical protein
MAGEKVYCTFGAVEPWEATVLAKIGKKIVVKRNDATGAFTISVPRDTVFSKKSEAITRSLRAVVAKIAPLHALEQRLRRAAAAAKRAEEKRDA